MKTFKLIIAIASIVVGALFLFNSASDIQLGFGVTLLAIGLLHL